MTLLSSLKELPQSARVWIFALDQTLTEQQSAILGEGLDTFVSSWKSHGTPVPGAYELRYGRFVVIGAAEPEGVSGCSIDSLTREVRKAAETAGVWLADLSVVHYRDGDRIVQTSRDEFSDLVAKKSVHDATIVFDNTVSTLSELDTNAWELPLSRSWHRKL